MIESVFYKRSTRVPIFYNFKNQNKTLLTLYLTRRAIFSASFLARKQTSKRKTIHKRSILQRYAKQSNFHFAIEATTTTGWQHQLVFLQRVHVQQRWQRRQLRPSRRIPQRTCRSFKQFKRLRCRTKSVSPDYWQSVSFCRR